MVNDSTYYLMTKASRKVMGRNKQLDKGTGTGTCRKAWKCLDPLNCVALAAFRKHGTWVQTWTWNFWGEGAVPAEPLTSVIQGITIND